MQEHQLLLEVSFVVAMSVQIHPLGADIFQASLKWLRSVCREILGSSAKFCSNINSVALDHLLVAFHITEEFKTVSTRSLQRR